MKNIPDLGLQIPQVYLPKPGTDLTRWAVIACDQFTSEPDYWEKVESIVGDAPSTLNITLPEIFIDRPDASSRITNIQSTMRRYLDVGILQPFEGMIYVERSVDGKNRKGIIAALDLERYDYSEKSTSLIRATEGTIIDRLPPRMKIRENALLELPHILVLIDDPHHTVIEPISAAKSRLEKVYDFDLMFDSGHLCGYGINQSEMENNLLFALRDLARPENFSSKYDVNIDTPVLLYAMGDGNHSLATAKAIWENIKPVVGMDHPARYALVEIENVHDEGLAFEPIHRLLFGLKKDFFASINSIWGNNCSYIPLDTADEMITHVDAGDSQNQRVGVVGGGNKFGMLEFAEPTSNLAVGTLQPFLDIFLNDGGADKIDYVHGADVTLRLGDQDGNLGFYLPGMQKGDLFKTVILDGALPRKTFSMGEAHEKRFYMESRKIA
jgi:hypothetical protein